MATKKKEEKKDDKKPSIEERVKKIEEYLAANASGFRRG